MSACPKCLTFNAGVTMTRKVANGWIKRYRHCRESDCGHRFITFELPGDELELPANPEALKEIHTWKSRQ